MTRSTRCHLLLALAGLLIATPTHAAEKPKDNVAEEPQSRGILLGRFHIRDLRAVEGVKLRLSFALYAEVDEEDAESVAARVEKRKHRIRNEVITAVRTVDQAEFQEPGLEHFRRRLLMRLRRTESTLPIEQLLVGEFEFFTE